MVAHRALVLYLATDCLLYYPQVAQFMPGTTETECLPRLSCIQNASLGCKCPFSFLACVSDFSGCGTTTHPSHFEAQSLEFYEIFFPVYSGAQQAEFMEKEYTKPWCRIGPYLIGILLAYVLFKKYRIKSVSKR